MDTISRKRCTKCGELKDKSQFVKDPSKKDGLYSSCKDCYKRAYRANPQKHQDRKREWLSRNRDAILGKKKEYRERNRESLLQKLKNYHAANKEKEKEYRKKNRDKLNANAARWARENRPHRAGKLREWRAANPEKVHIQKSNRRFREKGAEGEFSAAEWDALLKKFGYKCLRCGREGVKLTPDHVVPISRGGSNTIDNIQPLCRSCNSWKGNRVIVDFRV